jgi:hypothetical protein
MIANILVFTLWGVICFFVGLFAVKDENAEI